MTAGGARGLRVRCVVLMVCATAVGGTAVRILVAGLAPRVRTVDDALVQTCLLALIGCTVWAGLAVVAAAAEVWRGVSTAGTRPGVPRVVRRVVFAACGVAVVGALGQPALAAEPDPGRPLLAGLPMPERATGGLVTSAERAVPRRVLVRPGDSLWSLAAAQLPASAPDVRIDALWRQIYRLNRAVVGPDPDLILPGQLLELPSHSVRPAT